MDAKFDPKFEQWLSNVIDIVLEIKDEANSVLEHAVTTDTIHRMASGIKMPVEVLENATTETSVRAAKAVNVLDALRNKLKGLIPQA